MKRDDLQGIRGVAILLVLTFHLKPNLFPLGFVGVDMFFVLSGFLMAMILSKDPFSTSQLKNFYSRRFKRIVPLMYIILAITYIVCAFLLTEEDKTFFTTDLKWSLSFTSNIQPLFDTKGYWDQVSSYRFLVHCWSLGVELQFYCIAPFILAFTNSLSNKWRQAVLILLSTFSLVFQLLTPPDISYDLLPSRVWQFLLGAICYEQQIPLGYEILPEQVDEKIEPTAAEIPEPSVFSRCSGEILLIFLYLSVIFDLSSLFSESTMRIFGTFLVAFLIKWPQDDTKSLLTSKFFVYTGDISYVMYLIHWPIIVGTRYLMSQHELHWHVCIGLLVGIFLLSSLLHHTLEINLLSSSLLTSCVIYTICLLFIFATLPFYNSCCSFKSYDIKVQEAIKWNEYELKKLRMPCPADLSWRQWTNYTEELSFRCVTNSTSTLKVMLIGNSIAFRALPVIRDILGDRYKEMLLFYKGGRVPLTDMDAGISAATHIVAEKFQPDIIWHIHSSNHENYTVPFKDPATDELFRQIQGNVDFYSNHSKVFIIDLPYFWGVAPESSGRELLKRLKLGQPLDDLKISKKEAEKQQFDMKRRILAAQCENCLYNDVEPKLFEGDFYYYYNRANYHMYTVDGWHFTPEMLDRLKPLYEEIIEKALKRIHIVS